MEKIEKEKEKAPIFQILGAINDELKLAEKIIEGIYSKTDLFRVRKSGKSLCSFKNEKDSPILQALKETEFLALQVRTFAQQVFDEIEV